VVHTAIFTADTVAVIDRDAAGPEVVKAVNVEVGRMEDEVEVGHSVKERLCSSE
jgi:hypothetical protein